MQKVITQQPSADDMIRFIDQYRQFEKLPLASAFEIIRSMPGVDKSLGDHICGHWRGKRKGFGSFFLNLSYEYRYFFINRFGLALPEDKDFVDRHVADPVGTVFDKPTGFLHWANGLLVFFENHGIVERPAPGIVLATLPKPNKSFGNSSNWADYILSHATGRELIIDQILRHLDI